MPHPKPSEESQSQVEAERTKKDKKDKKKRKREEANEQAEANTAEVHMAKKTKKKKHRSTSGSQEPNHQPNNPSANVDGPASAATDAIMAAIVTAAANQTAQLSHASLSMNSTEDVLRVLQGVDVDRVADLLKNIGGSTQQSLPSLQAALQQPTTQVHRSRPTPTTSSSTSIAEVPRGPPTSSAPSASTSTLNFQLPALAQNPPSVNENDHAYILAHKWMSPSRLGLLAKTQGLVYKKGKFSAIEEQQLTAAIDNYRSRKGLSETQIQDIIFPKDENDKDTAFWTEITSAVPQRPIIAVYHHIRRARHPLKHQGKWSEQEDAILASAVAELGQQWEKISLRVGRTASDCRDRYRNHLVDRGIRSTGPWSKEEEEQLIKIVTDITVKQNKDWDNDVFWTKVSQLMGGKRGRQQCRIKWTDSLSKTVKTEGEKIRWGQRDAYILVHKVDALNVRHDTEIDWKTLSDSNWNLWSAHMLQRRWHTMKKSIKGHEDMSHQEIMEILKTKKGQVPDPPVSNRRRKEGKTRRITSAEAIEDEPEGPEDLFDESLTNIDPALMTADSSSKT